MARRAPKLSQGALNKKRWGFRQRKRHFLKKMAAAVEVTHRRNQIAKGTLQTDEFSWGKQYIPWWEETRRFVIKRDRKKCRVCKMRQAKKDRQIHHIVPRKYGGDEKPINLLLLCPEHHKRTEFALMNSGLFDEDGKWRKLSRKELLIKAIKVSGLKQVIIEGPPKE